MSQYDFGTIDPFVNTGEQLADMLNNWRDAIHSWHRGPTRPGYAVPGMMWVNDTGGPTGWIVNVYMGPTVGDVAWFGYDTTTGAITMQSGMLLAQTAALPSVRWNATGNGADQKAWRSTVLADGTLKFSPYTDAGVEIAPGILMRRDGKLIADLSGSTGIPLGTYVGTAPPPAPPANQLWWKSDDGVLYIYYNDGNTTQWVPAAPPSPAPAGSILQVQSATKTDTFNSVSTAFIDIPGLSVTLTPRNVQSRFKIDVALGRVSSPANYAIGFRLLRNGVPCLVGQAAGNRQPVSFSTWMSPNSDHGGGIAFNGLDAPALAVAITYKLQGAAQAAASFYINRTTNDSDGGDLAYQGRGASTLTVMEVAG